eukprot:TRINITY_DN67800_c1_g1_i1.p1 TRINITY_DN67800_c1_g1~~TRINITY_DN67800_c1_g1_i1.p1  ORF type:complete len:218 (-),score=3.31 TRINITY_DN67800_c1_g1_i1:41-694(-)
MCTVRIKRNKDIKNIAWSSSAVLGPQATQLWQLHQHTVQRIGDLVGISSQLHIGSPAIVTVRTNKLLSSPHQHTDNSNYVYLLHGTSNKTAQLIAQNGFDVSFNKRSLYGKGLYFTDQWCKAVQYATSNSDDESDSSGCVIVARVVLGDVFLLPSDKSPVISGRHIPYYGIPGVERNTYHSLWAKAGHTKWGKNVQLHNEFVVQDGRQCYPEYLVAV